MEDGTGHYNGTDADVIWSGYALSLGLGTKPGRHKRSSLPFTYTPTPIHAYTHTHAQIHIANAHTKHVRSDLLAGQMSASPNKTAAAVPQTEKRIS